ncbi:MAG: glycosyltransferase [Chthoniobacteraceae bacterium]
MNVHFFQPPPEGRTGGLDAAILALHATLERHGIHVDGELPAGGNGHVVHFHGLWQADHARKARECRRRGVPYIVSPHGMLEQWSWRQKWWKKWPYFQLIEKQHLAAAASLLATGPKEGLRLRRFAPRQRIESLPLGLTGDARPDYKGARQKLGWAPEEIVLLFLSRLHVKKGADILLKALASMEWPAVTRLVMVGDGDRTYVDSVKRFAADHAKTLPRIDWVGAVWGESRWKYFQGADLYCLPTHSENFGLAVLEATQVGTRTLTTVDTPWSDELSAGRGLLATPTVGAIREQLAIFFSSARQTASQRDELSDWAWNRFAWNTLTPRYVELYRSVLRDQAA